MEGEIITELVLSLIQPRLLRRYFVPDTEPSNVPASQEHAEITGLVAHPCHGDNACPHQLVIDDHWVIYTAPATWPGSSRVVTRTCCLPSVAPFWVVPNCCLLPQPSLSFGNQNRFCSKLGNLSLKSLCYVFSVNFKLISLRNNLQRRNKLW